MSVEVVETLVDSVMGNLKALLQEMSNQVESLEKQWQENSRELRSHGNWQMFEPTEKEEWERTRKQRACDELYDKAQAIRECMNLVAGSVNKIIGENIVIQFSKWGI
jgi:flagellar biosynthesis chaperone FliJ